MACEHPLLAVRLPVKNEETGKDKVKIIGRFDNNIAKVESRYGLNNCLLLPCGSCPSCKVSHQRDWAVRCSLESGFYKDNCMITLTYEDRLRPRKLVKRDLQDFIKKMRNRGISFRYFACGEYGSKSGHAHYHIIMFGYWPKDAKFDFTSKSGYPVYSSKFVSDVWHKGITTVSEMSPGTAAYVAGYVDKKRGQDEFILCSTRPGIGARYFEENLVDIYRYDNLVGQFGIAKLPRYCDKIAERSCLVIDDVLERRRKAANSNIIDLMQDHSLSHKDEAVGYKAKQMHDKLVRKERM